MAGARPRCRGKKPTNSCVRSFPNRGGNWNPSFSARGNGRVNCRMPAGWPAHRRGQPLGFAAGQGREARRHSGNQPRYYRAEASRSGAGAPGRYPGGYLNLVGTADLEGRVLYLNRAGRIMLGIGVDEEISGLTVKDLQPEWASRFIRDPGAAEAIGAEVWSGETTFRSRNGQEIPTSQVVIVHKGASGKVSLLHRCPGYHREPAGG